MSMLVIKIELHPHGRGGVHVKELARMEIANVGGTDEYGDYEIRADNVHHRRPWDAAPLIGTVTGHARETEPVWSLVAKALASIGFGANAKPIYVVKHCCPHCAPHAGQACACCKCHRLTRVTAEP